MPVRVVVKRSGRHFRMKFPSKKNGRMIGCESILEGDGTVVLEYDPNCLWYEEQPSEEIYYDEQGAPRKYYPDFRSHLVDGSEIDIEVKPSGKLADPKVARKLSLVAKRYRELGRRFEIWTEEEIRAEPRFSALKAIHRARSRLSVVDVKPQLAALGDQQELSFGKAASLLGGTHQVHRLIALDVLRADFQRALDDEALVWLANFKGGRRAAI